MYFKNPYIALWYRIIFLMLCGYGILRHTSFNNPYYTTHMFSYFTIQSNIFCFIVFVILTYKSTEDLKHNTNSVFTGNLMQFKGMATMAISITFLCYQFVLRDRNFSMDNDALIAVSLNNILVHYLVPLMVIFDWLLFQPKGLYHWYDPYVWTIAPITYFFIIMTRAVCHSSASLQESVSKYPYFFLNIDTLGIHKVMMNAFFFGLVSVLIGYVIVIIDHCLCGNYHLKQYKTV